MRLVKSSNKRIDLSNGEYIEVVADISKRTFNDLVRAMPQDVSDQGMTPTQGTQFQSAVFEAFVKGWSVEDENGTPLEADVDTYLSLPNEFASEIDEALMDHFTSLTVKPEDSKKRATSRAG
jgi:hypothetical protein